MSMTRYQVRITDDAGVTVAIPRDFGSCRYTLRADGEIGAAEIVLPRKKYERIMDAANPDYRLQFWRSVNGGRTYRLDGRTEFFALQWETSDDSIRVTAPSIQHLLTRRINAYYAGYQDIPSGAGAIYSGPASTIMRQVVDANFITGVGLAARDVFGPVIGFASGILSIGGLAGVGPLLNVAVTRENVFDIISKVADAAFTQGRWMAGLMTSNGGSWTFAPYLDYAGIDRRQTLILSPDARNIQNAVLNENSINEKSSIIAAGRGTGSARYISNVQSAAIIARSLYGYKEMFVENTNARNAQIVNLARSALRKNRMTTELTCDLTQLYGTIRGIHYDVGDYLRVQYLGKRFDMRLDMVEVSLTGGSSVESARLST